MDILNTKALAQMLQSNARMKELEKYSSQIVSQLCD